MPAHEGAERVFCRGLRLRGGGPLQQVLAAEGHAPQRAGNSIEHQKGLHEKLRELPGGRRQTAQDVA